MLAHLTDGPRARVVAFALLGSLVVGTVFGWLRAACRLRRLRRRAPWRPRPGAAGRARLRRVLVASEVALCAMLLVGAGLPQSARSALVHQDLGFQPNGVLTAQVIAVRALSRRRGAARVLGRARPACARCPGSAWPGSAAAAARHERGFEIVGRSTPRTPCPIPRSCSSDPASSPRWASGSCAGATSGVRPAGHARGRRDQRVARAPLLARPGPDRQARPVPVADRGAAGDRRHRLGRAAGCAPFPRRGHVPVRRADPQHEPGARGPDGRLAGGARAAHPRDRA